MKTTMKTWMLAFALCSFSSSAFGQAAEFSISGGAGKLTGRDIGSGYSLDDGFNLTFRLGLNPQKFFGHEFGYAYNRSHLLLQGVDQGGMAIHQGFYNFLVHATPEGSRIRPFGTAGVHFSNFVPPGSSATQGGGSTKFGVNAGAGIKVRVTSRYQIRADYRAMVTGKPFDLPGKSGKLVQNIITVGVGLVL
jgi:opacity protein-like surface antigen